MLTQVLRRRRSPARTAEPCADGGTRSAPRHQTAAKTLANFTGRTGPVPAAPWVAYPFTASS